jgi:hypothetical protein
MLCWLQCGSGSVFCLNADPDTDPHPDPGQALQSQNVEILHLNKHSFACYFLKVHFHYSSKKKGIKKSQNSRNQGLCHYVCLIMEGFGSGR